MIYLVFHIANHEHIIAFVVCGKRELRNLSRMRPPILNADSEATVVMGMLKISRATNESFGKRLL